MILNSKASPSVDKSEGERRLTVGQQDELKNIIANYSLRVYDGQEIVGTFPIVNLDFKGRKTTRVSADVDVPRELQRLLHLVYEVYDEDEEVGGDDPWIQLTPSSPRRSPSPRTEDQANQPRGLLVSNGFEPLAESLA